MPVLVNWIVASYCPLRMDILPAWNDATNVAHPQVIVAEATIFEVDERFVADAHSTYLAGQAN